MENNLNKTLPSEPKEDNIISMKPHAIKMDILLFKNDVLGEIKQIEKGIIDKSKETNDILKDKISVFDNKVNFIKEQISSLSTKMVNGANIEEQVNRLLQSREQLLDETTTNKIKISMLEKETRDSINRIDELLKETIIYPSVIGIKGKFRNFHDFIDFVVAESNTNNNFRQKNVMDLSSYKLKIEKSLQALGFKIESILSSCNSFTLRNIKEIEEKFEYSLGQYKDKLNELRIENSNYVIQLEKDTKDLRNETNIIKAMKNDIFSKVDENVDDIKKENLNIVETFKKYKESYEEMDRNIKNIEKKIENLMTQKIMILFDSQQKINENIEELRKQNYEFYNDSINEKIKSIVNEQVKNVLGDVNIKQVFLNNNFNNEGNSNNDNNINNNFNNNLNNNNINNINENHMQEKNNNINMRKSNRYSINSKNMLNTNGSNYNKTSLFISPRKNNIENKINAFNSENIINDNNYNYNFNKYNRNSNYNVINEIMNKKLLESINKNTNTNNIQPSVNNNINENILYEIKNDNILSVKKSRDKPIKKRSFRSDSNKEDINNISNNYPGSNENKFFIKSRNKEKNKMKYAFKVSKEDIEKDNREKYNDFNDERYIKFLNFNKIKFPKRNSFDKEKKKDLHKFQKLLKININDIDAKFTENVSSSFEILNENMEIYDRFAYTNNIISKDDIQNINIMKNENNKTNIFSPLKLNIKEKDDKNFHNFSNKNIFAARTSSDFYPVESVKISKNESALKIIKNKKILKMNKKINENNSNLTKKTNSDLFNLQSDLKNRIKTGFINKNSKTSSMGILGDQNSKQSEDYINKYHNYFIGFQFGNGIEDNKKIRKKRRKSKSSKYSISEDRNNIIHKSSKK